LGCTGAIPPDGSRTVDATVDCGGDVEVGAEAASVDSVTAGSEVVVTVPVVVVSIVPVESCMIVVSTGAGGGGGGAGGSIVTPSVTLSSAYITVLDVPDTESGVA
jgi:hypothetical protein